MIELNDQNEMWLSEESIDLSKLMISFLIANYNYSEYLQQSIESIAKQTWLKIEVIIIDDASTDNSFQLIEKMAETYKDRFTKFKMVKIRENMGKLHALETGLSYVNSPITIILDADDTLSPLFSEKTVSLLIKEARKDDHVAFVYTDCMLIDTEGKELKRKSSKKFDKELLERESYIPETAPTLTSVLRKVRAFIEPKGIRIEESTKHYKWKKMVDEGWKGIYLPEPLLNYRMHDRNKSGIGEKFYKDRNAELSENWAIYRE